MAQCTETGFAKDLVAIPYPKGSLKEGIFVSLHKS